MIWRHILLGLAEVESVPSYVLDRVGRLARGLGAGIELFNCIYDPELARAVSDEETLNDEIRGRMERQRRRVERVADILRDQGLDARASVRWDRPIYEAIIRQGLHSGSSLVIVPAGRLGHAGPVALTYTDARLIETCPFPLLLLKTEEVYREGPVIAAIDPGHAHEKSVELDDKIVAAAKTLSYALAEAPVQVYHAVPPGDGSVKPPGAPVVANVSTESAGERLRWAERAQDARKLAARHDIAEDRVLVEVGAVESRLPLHAREARATAVVMGAVSRAYPARALFGYTAERVLDALDCDVLIVKPKGFRTPVSRRPPALATRRARSARADHVSAAGQSTSNEAIGLPSTSRLTT